MPVSVAAALCQQRSETISREIKKPLRRSAFLLFFDRKKPAARNSEKGQISR
jgi:hypothetical protein